MVLKSEASLSLNISQKGVVVCNFGICDWNESCTCFSNVCPFPVMLPVFAIHFLVARHDLLDAHLFLLFHRFSCSNLQQKLPDTTSIINKDQTYL